MRIKVLGTRGEILSRAPYHSKHSGILINDILLFDLGEKSFLNLQPKFIFITHLHPDHAFFVRDRKDLGESKSILYLPESYPYDKQAKIFTKSEHFNGYRITPIPTQHSLKVKSQGYLITTAKERIFYTGDMMSIEDRYLRKLGKLKLVITEGSFIRRTGLIRRDKMGRFHGHTGIPDLISLFSQFTQNILFVHFGTWFYKDIQNSRKKIQALSEKHGLNLYVGYDGMIMDTFYLA